MVSMTTKYRALSPDERHEQGDEFKPPGGYWEILDSAHVGLLVGNVGKCRRPIPEPESPWIPISAPPMADADDEDVLVLLRSRKTLIMPRWQVCSSHEHTHWMRIPPLPLPEPEPTNNEALAKRIAEGLAFEGLVFHHPSTIARIIAVLNEEYQE